MFFEWDPKKARQNLKKHGLSFDEAVTVFGDPSSVTVHDPDHSIDEDRFITFGTTSRGRRIMVSHAEREDRIRIISAREMTGAERRTYEEESQG